MGRALFVSVVPGAGIGLPGGGLMTTFGQVPKQYIEHSMAAFSTGFG